MKRPLHPGLKTLLLLLTLAVGGAVALPDVGQTACRSSVEQAFAEDVSMAATAYALAHQGRAPASWEDLRPYRDAAPHDATMMQRYAFLQPPMPLTAPFRMDAALYLMTRRPVREVHTRLYPFHHPTLGAPCRYIIVRSGRGAFSALSLSEREIQGLFHGREAQLPTPDTEPTRPWESQAEWGMLLYRGIIATLFFLVLYVLSLLARAATHAARADQQADCL